MKKVVSTATPDETNHWVSRPEELDLETVQGLKEHFTLTGAFPILVLREKRCICTIINPFPGIWRLAAAGRCLSLMSGRNSYKDKSTGEPLFLELSAGDELVVVPLMSAHQPTGPRIQVPALLGNQIGEVESSLVSPSDDETEALEEIQTLIAR